MIPKITAETLGKTIREFSEGKTIFKKILDEMTCENPFLKRNIYETKKDAGALGFIYENSATTTYKLIFTEMKKQGIKIPLVTEETLESFIAENQRGPGLFQKTYKEIKDENNLLLNAEMNYANATKIAQHITTHNPDHDIEEVKKMIILLSRNAVVNTYATIKKQAEADKLNQMFS